jgi:pimeloyl-ACP methyl ester carboxylesterase
MGILHSSTTTKYRVEELKRQQLRSAEARLLQLYPAPDDAAATTVIEVVSTNIPAVLLSSSSSSTAYHHLNNNTNKNYRHLNKEDDENDEDDYYSIHSLKITTRRSNRQEEPPRPQPPLLEEEPAEPPPLVLLHGYMNGAGYFYRNFAGLARSFPQLYALDLLGWGLSSRPPWPLSRTAIANDPDPIAASERFFVDSLEAWRQAERIDKMILAGHSMGGYLAVAYAERYPHRVDQLVLLSPVGVPVASSAEMRQKRLGAQSFSYRIAWGLYEWVFRWCTPGDILRLLPESVGRYRLQQYVERRLPAIDQKEEQSLLAEYLYHNGTLPGSGEYCLPHLLTASVFGKRPLVDRIPHLPIAACHFFYGEHDWMDVGAALDVQERCRYHHRLSGPANDGTTATTATTTVPPKVTVHQVRHAGHLLMLDNPEEFNNGLAKVAARSPVLVGSIPQELFRPPRMTTNITAVSSSMQDE